MYKLARTDPRTNQPICIIKNVGDGWVTSIPLDPDNRDYAEYLKWLAEGNTPEPADEQGAA